ncbi:MAG: hypothetical protein JWP87_1384 [Labilithrix sp.]|nr:hypothetical protein [Labilithrix sp.]
MLADVPIRTKRWNDRLDPDDGYRLLICRYRPRGVAKSDETWDAWCKALGPSEELHAAAYGKTGPALAFPEYERRFLEEMSRQRYWIEGFAAHLRRGETITLLCSSACVDASRCHRTIVKRLLEAAAAGPTAAPKATANDKVVRRRGSSYSD